MPSFGYAAFALAGLAAATAPLVIHLLNRRRFRVMRWAAMDFLLQATKRSRRILNIRDILLLLLRTACVLLFALALARPYFTSTADKFDPTEPVHAVMIVDNSLSMGYFESNAQTLLEIAKDKGREFIERLPDNSRISVIPLFGTPAGYSRDAFRSPENAIEQLDRIEVVEQGITDDYGLGHLVSNEALEAQKRLPEMAGATRVVFLGDQQDVNWREQQENGKDREAGAPDIQVVEISPSDASNTWIADFQPQDVVAVAGAMTTFTATVRHEGPEKSLPRRNVEVIFSVDGHEDAERQYIESLQPGSVVQVVFKHRIDQALESGATAYVAATVEIVASDDPLTEDNARHIVLPVVQSVPVLFVDQHGADEDPTINKYGETHSLRLLMETNQSDEESDAPLVAVQQATIEEVSESLLEDKRLVVIAGVSKPKVEAVRILNEYIRQGGQVILAAGADFDSVAWNVDAWADGQGILPVPLGPDTIGHSPYEPSKEPIEPFQIDFKKLGNDYFILPGVRADKLEELYALPYFFQAVAVDESDETREELKKATVEQLIERLQFLSASDIREREWSDLERRGELTDAQVAQRESDREQRHVHQPEWLTWSKQLLQDERPAAEDDEVLRKEAEEIAKHEQPQVIAWFSSGRPFMIERSIGRGRVVFVTSGVSSDGWGTIHRTNAILMFDRIMRKMVADTLPKREFDPIKPIELPVAAVDRNAQFVLSAPGEEPKLIDGESLRADVYGVSIKDVTRRGIYRVTALEPDVDITDDPEAQGVRWQVPLAVIPPERASNQKSESELAAVTKEAFEQRTGENSLYTWVSDEISLQGGQIRGQDLWWWLIVFVLVALLIEWLIIAWPQFAREKSE